MCAAFADLVPLWAPGTRVGYQAWTFGWILGEVVRRVDGRPLARFAWEELCAPLGIADFYLGIPDAVEGRVATLREAPLAAVPPAAVVNRPDVRQEAVPGSGIMSARAIARHYALLAGRGTLDGVRLISPGRIEAIRAPQGDAVDEVAGAPARRGLGYGLGGEFAQSGSGAMGRASRAFGHGGNGGSLGFADPERELAFGLIKTLMLPGLAPDQTAAYLIAEAIRTHLDSVG